VEGFALHTSYIGYTTSARLLQVGDEPLHGQ
jgi:hypothetical protein